MTEPIEHKTTITLPITLTVEMTPTGWRGTKFTIDDSLGTITDAVYEQLEDEVTALVGCGLRPESRKPTASEESTDPQP